jgi:hypothetical protein
MEYLIRNSLNPGKVVSCTITFRQIVNKGEEGELVWLVQINTAEPHKDGGEIAPLFIHYVSSDNLDAAIKSATETIAEQVDWSPLYEDLRPPFVSYSSPSESGDIVSLYSNVVVDIKDLLPAAGIDPDSITVTVNGFDVTDELDIIGDPYEYRVIWDPFIRVADTY